MNNIPKGWFNPHKSIDLSKYSNKQLESFLLSNSRQLGKSELCTKVTLELAKRMINK